MPASTRHSRARDDSMPYKYDQNGLEFGVTGFAFGEGESGSPDYEDHTIPLYGYGDWDKVTIEGSVTVENSIEEVFPDEEGPPFPARLTVVVDSEETQIRFAEDVERSPLESGTYNVEITLQREMFRGEVLLTPRVVRTESCREGLPYAPNVGMRVAGGESWKLLFDEPEENGDGFPWKFRDFSQDGAPPVELAHSFSPPSDAKFMINDQQENIVDVMQSSTNTGGFRPFLKKALKAEFGAILWIQLVMWTATELAEGGEPEYNWQEGVIREIATSEIGPYIFDSDVGYEAVVDQLGERVSDPGELRDFVTDLCEAVQLYNDYGECIDYFIEKEKP